MKWIFANENIKKAESLNEGKTPIKSKVIDKTCEIIYMRYDDGYLFFHVFINMEWKLMEIIDRCVNMHINHVHCHDECLILFFGESECDQTGGEYDNPWHV